MSQPTVSIAGVRKSFGAVQAVKDVSFEVFPGEVFGLLGPNGAGKTTTIRMMLDIFRPDGGEVKVFGGRMDEAKKRRIGYLPEDRGLYRDLKLEPTLTYLAALKGLDEGEARRRLAEWLKRFDLWEHRQKKVQDLSKGMQQKAQMIATLVHEPDLIVVDEPFSGLDPLNTRLVKEIIEEQRQAGRTIIMSAHQMHQVETMCNRIVLINQGRTVLYGEVSEIKRGFSTNAVILEGAGDFENLPGVLEARHQNGSWRLSLAPGASPQVLLREVARREGVQVTKFELAEPSLDDIFVAVVQGQSGTEGVAGSSAMRNAWLIGKAEYLRMVRRKSFILSALGLPLLILAVAAIMVWIVDGRADHRPLGVVDLAEIVRPDLAPETYTDDEDTPVLVFADEPAARAALDAGETQAYYVISADYLKSHDIALVYENRAPSERVERALSRFLQASLAQRVPSAYRDIATRGVALWQRDLGDGRESSPDGFPEFLVPFILGVFFVMTVMGSGGYLLQAVSTEKENRMVEVMFTSVSPLQFIGGKAGGLMAAALTQTLALVATLGIVALVVLLTGTQVTWLSQIRIPWAMVGMVMLFFLPTFALVAGLMITIGAIFDELQYAQQIAGLLNLLFLLPLFFFALVFSNPDGPLMVALTLFPTTSMMGIALRWGFTVIPVWQIVLSFALLAGSAVGMIWVAGRVFRVGMLRYGQPLNIAALRGLLAGGRPSGSTRPAQGR